MGRYLCSILLACTLPGISLAAPKADPIDAQLEAALDGRARLAASAHLAESEIDVHMRNYFDKELALEHTLRNRWKSRPPVGPLPAYVGDPLREAASQLDIEIRRRLGARFHTLVPGLTEDAGCAGDLVSQQLVRAYAESVIESNGDARRSAPALEKIARQTACLGARQLVNFEQALSHSFDAVAERMQASGFAHVLPAFVRLIAPVQVLVFDAGKHRGERSPSWRWFSAYGAMLADDVSISGWSTDQLLLWDRRHGVLVGFPECPGGRVAPDCVDLRRFLDSLRDPAALGLGGCSFASMVSNPRLQASKAPGASIYHCPRSNCDAASGAKRPLDASPGGASPEELGASGAVEFSALWPSSNRSAEDLGCRDGAGGGADLQGVNVNLEQCLSEIFQGDVNPFDNYLSCMSEAIGGDEPRPIGGTELHGVPGGPACGLMGDGATPAPAGNPPPKKEEPKKEDPKKEEPKEEDPKKEEPKQEGQGQAGTSTTTPSNNPAAPAGFVPFTPAPQNQNPHMGQKSPHQHHQPVAVTERLAQEERSKRFLEAAKELIKQLDKQSDSSVHGSERGASGSLTKEQLDTLRGAMNGSNDCVDPASCSNDCTGLGQQVAAVTECTEGFLDAVLTAAGIPNKKDNLKQRPNLSSHPDPNAEPKGKEISGGACFGAAAPERESSACGLMLCNDGFLAAGAGGAQECDCDRTVDGALPVSADCLSMRCPEGANGIMGANGQCVCQPNGETAPQSPGGGFPGPGPDPTIRSREAEVGGLSAEAAPDRKRAEPVNDQQNRMQAGRTI